MKKVLPALLLCSSAHSIAEVAPIEFDAMIETCSSLNTFNKMYSVCLEYGFSYPGVNVRYYSENNNEVILSVQQAKMGSTPVDYQVESVKVTCKDCKTPTDNKIAMYNAVTDLAKAANENGIEVKSKSKTAFIEEVAKNIFTSVASNLTTDWAKKTITNKNSPSSTTSPVIIIVNEDGKPLGSGRIIDGVLVTDIIMELNDKGQMVWSGALEYNLGTQVVSAFANLGGGNSCTVTYTGDARRMMPQIICF